MFLVAPDMRRRGGGEGGGGRPKFARKGKRICLQRARPAVGADDFELVTATRADIGKEDFPHAAAQQLAHRVRAAVPAVEIADDRHTLRIRRPHVERGAAPDRAVDLETGAMQLREGARQRQSEPGAVMVAAELAGDLAERLQHDRDVLLVRHDRETYYRFRCNVFADALSGAFLARTLARRRV